MAIMISRPRGSNTYHFRYRRLKRTQPAAPASPAYVVKPQWAMITVDGTEKKVEYQDKYTCRPGTFPNVQAQPANTYADRVHKRPANKIFRCIRCHKKGGPDDCGRTCTIENFFQLDDAKRHLELRETANMGIGVFTTRVLPKNQIIGIYTGDLVGIDGLSAVQRQYGAWPNWARETTGGRKVNIDASEKGNWTRFVNHHCVPNCSFSSAKACGTSLVHYIKTNGKDIPAGTQLFLDYGRGYFRNEKGTRIIGEGCKCRSSRCHSKKRARPAAGG